MNRKTGPVIKRIQTTVAALSIVFLAAFPALSQSGAAQSQPPPPPPPTGVEKAEHILKRATTALGGTSYLNVRSVVGTGLFTQFKEGQPGLPVKFIDYIVYPDRERTEFRGQGVRIIQTNAGQTGWVYDGASKTLTDMKPEQVEDFRRTLRTSVESLLRGSWRKDGAQLSYVGRREAGIGQRNETVRLVYADGLAVEFEFGARDGLPAKVIYKGKNREGEEITEEDRMAQHINVNGIVAPFIIDHYRAGVQSSRVNYESVEFNRPVDDSLFARPANAKAVK